MPLAPKLTGQNIALVAVFAGVIALSTVPPQFELASGVPITLQTLGVVLTGLVLGAWRGFAATVLYVLAGLANLPIYAGHVGGWGAFVGPTGGYIWAFPIAAFVVGWIAERVRANASGVASFSALMGAGLVSLPVVYAVGVPWLGHVLGVPLFTPAEDGGPTALAYGLLPFIVGDLLKVAAAAAVAAYVHRAFPQLLSADPTQFVTPAAVPASKPATTSAKPATKSAAKRPAKATAKSKG